MAPGLEVQRQTGRGARRVVNEGKTLHMENKLYSATVIYDDKDSSWVTCVVSYLEQKYTERIYYRGRDATPGLPVTENSLDSITNSNVIIVAITNAFLNNCWAKKEESWALFQSLKTGGCKLLPVLLEDCEIPKELSDLQTLNLTSVEKFHGEHLELLGKSLHKLLTYGQMCTDDGKTLEPTDTVNVPDPYYNGTLMYNNTATTSDNEIIVEGSPPDAPLMNLQCLLNILACKLVAMSINIMDFCTRGISTCFVVLEVLPGHLHIVKETMEAFLAVLARIILKTLKRMLQSFIKNLMSMLPAFLQEVVTTVANGVRFSGDGSFTTFAATWIYNASVLHFTILLVNGLLWQVSGYNIFQASLLDVVPLFPPLIKGYYCMLHMPEYRATIKAMYGCKTLTLKSMKDTLVQANVEYREVRICLLVTFAIEVSMLIGILGSVHISSLVFPMTRLASLLLLTLHFVFLLCVIIFYYHDSTVHNLISKRRFFFPGIMKREGFDKQEKRLLSMIDELNKQRKRTPGRKHLITGGKSKKYKRYPKPV